ncbi:MAG: HAD-IA family hydrolase [Chitinivibrionales bacterium]|nr:HAD-IA family hydrolase [Chitinivibrionales bacterium]
MHTSVSGIIFDFDGTLYHMGWYMRPLITLKLFPHIWRLSRYMKVRSELANKDMGSGEQLMNELCRRLAEKSHSSPAKMQSWIFNSFYPAFIETLSLFKNSRPGINKLLEKLHSNNIKLAILSDYDMLKERCERLNIDTAYFDKIVSSEAAGALKPAVRPFAEIQKAWDLPPEKILVIGDRDDTDGIAASQLGMQFMHMEGKKAYAGPNVRSWQEIKGFLSKLENGKS